MDIGIEISRDQRFKVHTNSMSTQIFGPYEILFEALTREMRATFERAGKAVFVMKVLGPFADPT